MGSIELSWIEGFVLYHHFFRRLPIADVADILGKSIPEATANRDSLIRKAAVALGYVTAKEAGIKLVMIEDEIIVRQREVKKLWEKGRGVMAISRALNIDKGTVGRDLKILGIRK